MPNEREERVQHAPHEWPWLFELADKFTTEAYQLLTQTEIGQKDGGRAIQALLFGRVISGAEALVELSRLGFLTESDVIFRSNLEALYRLAALVEDTQMRVVYLGEDYPRRRKAMEDVRQLLACVDPRPPGAVTEAQIDEAISRIDREAQEFRNRNGVDRLR